MNFPSVYVNLKKNGGNNNMKKTVLYTIAIAFVLSIFAVSFATTEDVGKAEMTLKTKAGKKPAKFPHAKHQEFLKCGDCHHGAADGKQVAYTKSQKIGTCESCHNDSMTNAKLNSFKNAAHANCKACHKKEAKAGKKAPTKCNGCHLKKKKQLEGC